MRSVGSTTARLASGSSAGLRVTHALMGAPSAGGPEGPLLRAVDETAPLYGPHRQKRTPSSTHTNVFVRRKSRQPRSETEIGPPPRPGRFALSVKMRRAELNRSTTWIPGRRGAARANGYCQNGIAGPKVTGAGRNLTKFGGRGSPSGPPSSGLPVQRRVQRRTIHTVVAHPFLGPPGRQLGRRFGTAGNG